MTGKKYIPEKTDEEMQIAFGNGKSLHIDKQQELLEIRNKAGQLQLSISLRDDEIKVSVNADHLQINAADQINLTSRKINIGATEQLNVKSGGNFFQQVEKDALSEIGGISKSIAHTHKISASLGNVEIKANDDVRLDGESVKLNCD